jgi:hypothetical protein
VSIVWLEGNLSSWKRGSLVLRYGLWCSLEASGTKIFSAWVPVEFIAGLTEWRLIDTSLEEILTVVVVVLAITHRSASVVGWMEDSVLEITQKWLLTHTVLTFYTSVTSRYNLLSLKILQYFSCWWAGYR